VTGDYDVAIVGAGFTGSALAIQLLQRFPHGSRVLLVGAPRSIGRGVAYGTRFEQHLLNVRADRMSVLPDDPAHFVRWLQRRTIGESAQVKDAAGQYASRRQYGRYVQETLEQTMARCRSGVRCDLSEGTVVELTQDRAGFVVRAASGERWSARVVALCLGHGPPDFPVKSDVVGGDASESIIADPWSDDRMNAIRPPDRVLFVGTGLTMVDQVLSLASRGHHGPLVAVSRHGLLPMAGTDCHRDAPAIDILDGGLSLRRLSRQVIDAARAEAATGGDWRSVIDGLRPLTPELWQRLDAADRRRFARHLEAFWSVHRHRMPPPVARQIASLRNSGRLAVFAARLLTITRAAKGVTAALRRRGTSTVELRAFDWIINCSGTSRRRPEADLLLAQLMAHGLARPDPLGRGLDVSCDSVVVGKTGIATTGLFALGPLSLGRFFEITAVPEIREQCAHVAGNVARLLAPKASPVVAFPHSAASVPHFL
jgi:uncharacterized NAD(P)/FAD-binding protein YdhS